MHHQIYSYVDKFLLPYLFGYRKNHSTEQCLTIMTEVWKNALDLMTYAGMVLTDLSKAFDCQNHNFIYNYLKERKQGTKVNSSPRIYSGITTL